jgi:tetratricopeptide (TPR) repeat protein
MGLVEYNNKRYATAYTFFEKVVNLYPMGYDALLMYAWTNYQLGKSREAKVLFGKVLLISPEDTSAKEGLGLIK